MRTARVIVLADAERVNASEPTVITTERTWTVGRAPESDIVVDDGRVSRQHLIVERTGPTWVIRDVSANGSWTGGARIGPVGVAIPDVGEVRLRLGDYAGPELVVIGEQAPAPAPSRRKRRRGWLIAALVAFALLLVVADRIAAAAASTVAVQEVVQSSQGLGTKPSVSFGGYPFLTQVVFGKYSDIGVGINDLTPPGGPHIEHLSAHLKGAHIPLSKAVHNTVKSIPVDQVTATVTIDYADLNAFLKNQPEQLVLTPANGGAVHIAGTVTENGSPITVSGTARLTAEDGQLAVAPSDLQISGTGGLDDLISGLGGLAGLFPPIPVPLPDLPFHLRITSAHASGRGISVSAAVDHVVLDAAQ